MIVETSYQPQIIGETVITVRAYRCRHALFGYPVLGFMTQRDSEEAVRRVKKYTKQIKEHRGITGVARVYGEMARLI